MSLERRIRSAEDRLGEPDLDYCGSCGGPGAPGTPACPGTTIPLDLVAPWALARQSPETWRVIASQPSHCAACGQPTLSGVIQHVLADARRSHDQPGGNEPPMWREP